MKKKPFKLTEQIIKEWKLEVIAYLRGLYPRFPKELEDTLLLPDVMVPVYKYKGDFLLQPGTKARKAYYLKKGFVKLYSIDPKTGQEQIFYIWAAGSIVVLYKAFREKLSNSEFYIEVMTDAEVVGITNFCMDDIYQEHIAAHELTQIILCLKTERRMKQTQILTMTDKKRRYCMLKQLFPEFFENGICLLTNEDVCAFINISDSMLRSSRLDCPDGY